MPRQFFQVPFVLAPDETAVQQVLDRLTELAKAAVAEVESSIERFYATPMFCRVLNQAMAIIDNAAEPKQSVGIRWLTDAENRILIRQLVSDGQRAAFFKVHLKNRYIVAMLEDRNLLSLIPEQERADFAYAVLSYWIPKTDNWISVVLTSLVGDDAKNGARALMMDAVLRWLRYPEDFEDGDTFAARFLRTGCGPSLKIPGGYWTLAFGCSRLWQLFKAEQDILDALTLCAHIEPNVFFEAPAQNDIPVSHKVMLRLGANMGMSVLETALSELESRDGLSAQGLDCLTKRLKRSVTRRPKICPLPFLVKYALDYIDGDGPTLFSAAVGQVTPLCTDYAADLMESFDYIREAKKIKGGAPCIPDRIDSIGNTLRRNAVLHPSVKLAELDL